VNWVVGLVGLPCLASPMVYVAGHRSGYSQVSPFYVTLGVLALLWALLIATVYQSSAVQLATGVYSDIELRLDGLSVMVVTLALTLTTLVVVYSQHDVAGSVGEEKYYAMILLLLGTIIGLSCTNDLFNMWIWFEGMAITSYLLVAFYRDRVDALRACVSYFIQTVSGSILVLFGIALVLIETGTLALKSAVHTPSPLLIVAGALFIMGFGVKLALFPSYTWLPNAYAESPTGISAMLSGVVTLTGLVALLKALAVWVSASSAWGPLLMVFGTLNITLGTLIALSQKRVKRILAYSSIAHVGYIVLAVGIGITTGAAAGLRGATLHLFVHGLMKALGFMAVGGLAYALNMRNGDAAQLRIDDLRGLARQYPGLATALVISLLGLVGVPPLAGFVSKVQILLAGLGTGFPLITGLILFAALNTVVTLAYFLPIVSSMFDGEPRPLPQRPVTVPLTMRTPIFTLMGVTLAFGLAPRLLDGVINPATNYSAFDAGRRVMGWMFCLHHRLRSSFTWRWWGYWRGAVL
jgi:proton-translocating NADH-quinone oxidoreductase chain N